MNNDISKELNCRIREANRWVERDLPRLVGKTAVDHFRRNFTLGGFQNRSLQKWREVERRRPDSPWYGFEFKGERRTAYAFSRSKSTGKTRKAKRQKKLNFSRAATVRKILNGRTHELQDSLRYSVRPQGVDIISDKPYAAIQNNGGTIKVFGRHAVRLTPRPFVGHSQELNEQVDNIIKQGMRKILKG